MKRSRFSEEQIIAVLKEQEAVMATAEVFRRYGISPATFTNGSRSLVDWSCVLGAAPSRT